MKIYATTLSASMFLSESELLVYFHQIYLIHLYKNMINSLTEAASK